MTVSILILTGQSGSGKSTVIRTLEDHGYFCVDNIPTRLVERLVDLTRDEESIENLALVMDVRGPHFIEQAPTLVETLRQGRDPLRFVYLEAVEASLIQRYSETRRRHPLDDGKGLRAAITREREILVPLRELADDTIDTSEMSPHDLRARVIDQIIGVSPGDALKVAFLSFGFKHGIPLEADTVLDVRFLANPYFEPSMRNLTGQDQAVSDFVVKSKHGKRFVDETDRLLEFLLPRYQAEGRRYVTVAIGCTGGQHRSVAIAHALAARLEKRGTAVDLRHRDIPRRKS